MSENLHTYRIEFLPEGTEPIGHVYWDWNGTQPTTVPAGVEWYKFVVVAPDGVTVAFEQDISPVDNGFIPMSEFYADMYGQIVRDIFNGTWTEQEIPTISSIESALNEA